MPVFSLFVIVKPQQIRSVTKLTDSSLKAYCPLFIMLVAGLEPARGCPRGILSPLRLPIPPHQHNKRLFYKLKTDNGTYRARTYDPLLVRQMLSQLS